MDLRAPALVRFWEALIALLSASRRTAFWVALASGAFAIFLARQVDPILLPWTVEGFLGTVVFFWVFFLAWGVGLVGAWLGWRTGGRRGWPQAGASVGVAGFWLGAGIVFWADLRGGQTPPAALLVSLFVLPLLMAWAAARWLPPVLFAIGTRLQAARERLHLTRFGRWFARHWLVRRREGRSWHPGLDLRGVAVGALAALIAMAVALTGAFDYLEAVSLASRVRLRNEAVITPAGSVEWARVVSLWARGVPVTREQPIVLLDMDDATIARIATDSSEPGVQRAVLERLQAWGAQRAVLPVSATTPVPADAALLRVLTRRPPVGREAIRRMRRDAPLLAETVRGWDRVLLFILSETFRARARLAPPPLRGGFRRDPTAGFAALLVELLRAAPVVGSADFGVYHVRQLPLLRPMDRQGRPSVPLLLTRASADHGAAGHALPAGWDQEPLIINVFGSAPGALFTHVSYTSVLEGRPVYDRARDRWVAPEEFFRGRIVFLDTLGQPTYDTPVGQLTTTELLAMATDNLLTSNRLLPPPRGWQFFLMLVVGALMGSLSIRRSPLRVAQRFLIVVGVYLVTAVALFIFPGFWMPTVSVTFTAALAALLVLQFVFTADESALERERAERVRLDQELAIGREIQTSLLPEGRSDGWLSGADREPATVAGSGLFPHADLLEGPGERSVVGGRRRESQRPAPSNASAFVERYGRFIVVGRSEPSREVGGDFYDVFSLEGNRLGLALGDVSGNGVPGALYMAVTTTLLQAHARLFAAPDEVLARANDVLYPRMRGGRGQRGRRFGAVRRPAAPGGVAMFVTAFYGVLEIETGWLRYASAGQMPPILTRPDRQARFLPARGVPLGGLRAPRYACHEVCLQPGERLLVASDGFVESPVWGDRRPQAQPAGPMGYERFLAMVAQYAHLEPAAFVAALYADFYRQLANPDDRDDLTLIVIGHQGLDAP